MKVEHVTDSHEGEIVVFMLGMKVLRPWRVDQWGFVTVAMARMMTEIELNRRRAKDAGGDIGYLGGFSTVGINGPVVTQYWRSSEDLIRYAHDTDRAHRGAWLTLYTMAHRSRATKAGVGLWHETYAVPAGRHETIYGNMKPIGLGTLVGAVPLGSKNRTAAERLGNEAPSPLEAVS